MTVPGFQEIMLPFLALLADGQDHKHSDLIETLAQYFELSNEERRELLPSGRQSRFSNRVGWARTYLGKAGLVENTVRGQQHITEAGVSVLKSDPTHIDIRFLEQFPEFSKFRAGSTLDVTETETESESTRNEQTPEEILESSYQNLRRNIAQELLERVKTVSPTFFEQLVVDLLVAMGYGGSRKDAGTAFRKKTDDEGIDGVINEDKLGLDVIYIQAKRWQGTVGRPIVQAFAGSLEGQRAKKGILITTSQFSQDAKTYVNRIEKKIVLIDGEQLTQYMLDYGVGVTERALYVVKRIDEDYFSEE